MCVINVLNENCLVFTDRKLIKLAMNDFKLISLEVNGLKITSLNVNGLEGRLKMIGLEVLAVNNLHDTPGRNSSETNRF